MHLQLQDNDVHVETKVNAKSDDTSDESEPQVAESEDVSRCSN